MFTDAQQEILDYILNTNDNITELGTNFRSPDWFRPGYGQAVKELTEAGYIKVSSEQRTKRVKHYFAEVTAAGIRAFGKFRGASAEDIEAAISAL
jgi:hypothetical protein